VKAIVEPSIVPEGDTRTALPGAPSAGSIRLEKMVNIKTTPITLTH
jgi:hypothetical protein